MKMQPFFIHTKILKKQVLEYTIAPCIRENSDSSSLSPCGTLAAASAGTWIIIPLVLQLVFS